MEERWLLYLDFLGTKDIFNELDVNGNNSRFHAFEKIIDYISQNNSHHFIHDIGNQRYIRPEYTSFSDHLAISYPLECDMIPGKKTVDLEPMVREQFVFPVLIKFLLQLANEIYDMALKSGILVRGTLVCGKLRHQGNKIYGPALILADELERKFAKYPRIIVSADIAHFFQNRFNPIHMIQDFDGIFYFNFFKRGPTLVRALSNLNDFISTLKEYKDQIEKNIDQLSTMMDKAVGEKKEKIGNALEKWKWIAKKFDDSLDHYAKGYFINKFPDIKDALDTIGKFNTGHEFIDHDVLLFKSGPYPGQKEQI